MRNASSGHAEDGFTLLEVLLSLALLAILLAIVPSTLRLNGQAWRMAASLETTTSGEAARSFLERAVASCMPVSEVAEGGHRTLAFDGEADALRFVATGGASQPGVFAHKLRLQRGAGEAGPGELVVSRSPFDAEASRKALPAVRHVLIEGVSELRLRYFGPPEQHDAGPAGWHSTWRGRTQLPALVEITFVSPGRAGRRTDRIVVEPRLRRPF